MNKEYNVLTKEDLEIEYNAVLGEYNNMKDLKLNLDMSRGKPSTEQLNMTMELMDTLTANDEYTTIKGLDVRNYGVLDGIPEAKSLFADLFEIKSENLIIGGNSSLNLMYDTVARAMQFGVTEDAKPWNKYEEIKFLCPSPGYDRHFAICELFSIKMIPIPMNEFGPDMDMIDELIKDDDTIKGIWCVPMYSNPEGITYSKETVERFSNLKPKATDFRIFWDNAYCVHHIYDKEDTLCNIFSACQGKPTEDMIFLFASTSKISFSGAGISILGASKNNIDYIMKHLSIQTIGFDKINQLRHVRFFKDTNGIKNHMIKHKNILRPKFDVVLNTLDEIIKPLGIADWKKPNGGYFVSFNTYPNCAKRVVTLCKEAGVVLTGAGATYPYGQDPSDQNIRIAPTYPPVSELVTAMNLFCICVKLATLEKMCNK